MSRVHIMQLLNIVRKLEGQTREDARNICMKLFAPFGIVEEHYKTGINLVVRKQGKSSKEIIIASHYDTFPGCTGANDNASATAVLYGIAHELWNKKLKHNLTICIFDEEEKDCIGSRAFVKQHDVSNVKVMIALELVGKGQVFGVWPVKKETPLVRTLTTVLKKQKTKYEILGKLPMFWADHQPFQEEGVDSLCLTLVPKKEVELIRPFITQNKYLVGLKVALGLMRVPKFFQIYHTGEDTPDKLSEKSLQLTKSIVIETITALQK